MQIFDSYQTLKNAITKKTGEIGFVPTMGALHSGHLSLIENAIKQNKWVVVSIFINPTQFNDPKDLEQYPINLEEDFELLSKYGKQLFIYLPAVADLYGDKIITKSYDFGTLDKVMEGAHRGDHFNGVATVVEKLFNKINPDRAYFGEKDFQQLVIIKKLVNQKRWPIEIIPCPIIREKDGLAMSSRNKLLTEDERNAAPVIHEMLLFAKSNFKKESTQHIFNFIKERIESFSFLTLAYFVIVDTETLTPTNSFDSDKKYRAFIAVKTPKIRLIDNIKIG